jgi:hypothetical protein
VAVAVVDDDLKGGYLPEGRVPLDHPQRFDTQHGYHHKSRASTKLMKDISDINGEDS